MPTYLPVSELAAMLGRAENTIRLWARHHAMHLPRSTDERGAATYPLERMIEIRGMYDVGMGAREVERELSRGGSEQPADDLLTVLREIRDDLRAIRQAVERNAAPDDGPT